MKPEIPLSALFLAALRLGCTSFGGPIAHLGYFHREYVERRRWVSAAEYAELVALCQFLPGPASSQVGFALGYLRGGLAGALVAWLGFTLPSALLMVALGLGLTRYTHLGHSGVILGLKIAAVAVVAQAVLAMWRSLCPDGPRSLLALLSAAILQLLPFTWSQIAVMLLGAVAGFAFFRSSSTSPASAPLAAPGTNSSALLWLAVFALLLFALPLLAHFSPWFDSAARFYRAGSLVFGGGHVVLPLLEREFVAANWVAHDNFLAGYAATIAMPGPLFTFAGFLGAANASPASGASGGAWGLLWIFLPGLLLVLGTLPLWRSLRRHPLASAALSGVNAAVVGLLLAALISPIGTEALSRWTHGALALAAFALLHLPRVPPGGVVLACAFVGAFFL